MKALQEIFDWSEVWALGIPLIALLLKPHQPKYLRPVIWYLWIALLINLLCDVISDFPKSTFLGDSNNAFYNIHSLVRFTCFSLFFYLDDKVYNRKFVLIVASLFTLFVIFNFTLFEKFFNYESFSSTLFIVESFCLLIFCLLYYLHELKADSENITSTKEFWLVTGLSTYVVINFFVFLFYEPLLLQNYNLAIKIWDIHNVAYILLCIFISKAFYAPSINWYRVKDRYWRYSHGLAVCQFHDRVHL